VQTISAWTESHRDFWRACLDRLDALLQQEMSRK